jgi:hypothetical protein
MPLPPEGERQKLSIPADRVFQFSPSDQDFLLTQAFAMAQPRSMKWIWVLLATAALGCLGLIITQPNLFQTQSLAPSGAAKAPVPKVAASQVQTAATATYPEPPECKLTLKESLHQVEALLVGLSSAKTMDERLICVASPDSQRLALAEFFAASQNQLKVEAFRALPMPAKLMPSGHQIVLFEAKTNSAGVGTSLIRLTGPDRDSLRLDWPLLEDSHTGALTTFLKTPEARPRWISLGLKRNFGFSESKPVRDASHVFDVQGQADGVDRTVALCAKDSAFGRVIDRVVSWDELYLIRLLVSWAPVDGKQRLVLIDAEHMPGTL